MFILRGAKFENTLFLCFLLNFMQVTVRISSDNNPSVDLSCLTAKFPADKAFLGNPHADTRALYANVILSDSPIVAEQLHSLPDLSSWQRSISNLNPDAEESFGVKEFHSFMEGDTGDLAAQIDLCRNSTGPFCRLFLGLILESGFENTSGFFLLFFLFF